MSEVVAALGFMVGLVVGMSAVGGGSLVSPLLILIAGVKPVHAVGTSLVYMALSKGVGALQHFRQGSIDLEVARRVVFGSVPGSLAGVAVISYLQRALGEEFDVFVGRFLALALIAASISLILQRALPSKLPTSLRNGGSMYGGKKSALNYAMSAGIGFIVSTTSIGSGSLLMPFLLLFHSLTPRKAIGTDILLAAIIAGLPGGFYMFLGSVEPLLFLSLLVGAIPGILLGSKLNHLTPERLLGFILAAVLISSAAALLLK